MAKKKRSLLLSIVKIIGIMLAIVLVLAVSGYCYLKYILGFDVFDVVNKIKLLNQDVSESSLISNPYNNEDASNCLNAIFGENTIYAENGDGEWIFDLEEYFAASLLDGAKITDTQLCALADIFASKALKGTDYEDFAKYFEIKQIKFSNLVVQDALTKANVNVVVKFNLKEMKESIGKENNVLIDFILNYIPEALYFTDDFTITVSNSDYSYSINSNYFVINQISKEQSQGIIKLYKKFFGGKESIADEIHDLILNLLFGSETTDGLLSSINGFSGFNFVEETNTIYMAIKKD